MGDGAGDRRPLVPQVVGDCALEARVRELVRRIGHDGPVAARELVLPLRAGLDALQPSAQREVDRLIVADLEMEKRALLDRAPVAAVERVVADEVDRARDIAAVRASPSPAGCGRPSPRRPGSKKRRVR